MLSNPIIFQLKKTSGKRTESSKYRDKPESLLDKILNEIEKNVAILKNDNNP